MGSSLRYRTAQFLFEIRRKLFPASFGDVHLLVIPATDPPDGKLSQPEPSLLTLPSMMRISRSPKHLPRVRLHLPSWPHHHPHVDLSLILSPSLILLPPMRSSFLSTLLLTQLLNFLPVLFPTRLWSSLRGANHCLLLSSRVP